MNRYLLDKRVQIAAIIPLNIRVYQMSFYSRVRLFCIKYLTLFKASMNRDLLNNRVKVYTRTWLNIKWDFGQAFLYFT